MKRKTKTKCLWCDILLEDYDEFLMYQFCDKCLSNLETLSINLDTAEQRLKQRDY